MIKNEKLNFISASLPDLKITHIQINDTGWDNDIIIINQDIVFRFPKSKQIANRVLKEFTLLKSLKTFHSSIKVPEYHLLYDQNRQLQCVYYQYIKGVTIEEYNVIRNTDENAKLLGEFLTNLHSLEIKTDLKAVHTYDFWSELYESVQKEIFQFLSEHQKDEVSKTFNFFLDNYATLSLPKSVIHGDLTSSNIIMDNATDRINGIIDFTDAQIGDPAFDFAGFYWDFGPEFTKSVLTNYHGVEASETIFERIKRFYGLQPVFHELLHSVRNGSPVDWKTALNKFSSLKKSNI